jgi:hypothetical protein
MSEEISFDIIDLNTDQVHDDVDLILNSSGPEIIELIASDPKYYLNIVSHYNKTRDGRDVYLQDLCNVLIVKNPLEYRIKFKLTDNSNWYEVGYCGDSFTEEEVHEAFIKKVEYALSRPSTEYRKMILDTLLPSDSSSPVDDNVNIAPGSVLAYSKMDRFMKRAPEQKTFPNEPFVPDTSRAEEVMPSAAVVKTTPASVPVPVPVPIKVHTNANVKINEANAANAVSADSSKRSPVLTEFDVLKMVCPEDLKDDFTRLVNLLNISDVFTETLISTLPKLSGGQRILVIDFLNKIE